MFALKSRQDGRQEAMSGRFLVSAAVGNRIVLPRWLRRPVRALSRIDLDGLPVPPFAATALTAVLFGATAAYGVVLGGHSNAVIQTVTAQGGFAVDDVHISGLRELSEIDVLGAVGLNGWTSLVGFDAAAARDRVAALPWVQSASVRKIYPDQLEVVVEEKDAFAIWQHGSELSLIERSGKVIAPFRGGHAALPLVVGRGAPEEARDIVAMVAGRPVLADRVKGYVRVADRRWDLRLANGVTLRLPEKDVGAAIDDLLAVDARQGLLSRDIAAVDLRIEDRFVVQLTPDAVEKREAALKQRLKGASGRRI
ncbi:cell division protein FtsQ/DivIB [Mesorhizobium xinjiangense]|uniref:cell division protein FtsQ/DivIB n=1 Tax=Mesorhizobium xinjiangense TaxID=2678685 RepID=UPI0012ED5239|nr:cell division protein FtsQ/DivIB [Mesorhizobium xinjiangense]